MYKTMPLTTLHHPIRQATLSPLQWLFRITSLLGLTLLIACGFHMRPAAPLPFDTLYTNIPDNTRFGADLRRAIQAISPHTHFVDSPQAAQAQLQQVSNERLQREVALNTQGRVEEYELTIQFTFRVIDAQGQVLLPDTHLKTSHEMSYNDQFIQAKARQMETLYQTMEQSIISRIIHHLSAPNLRAAAKKTLANP